MKHLDEDVTHLKQNLKKQNYHLFILKVVSILGCVRHQGIIVNNLKRFIAREIHFSSTRYTFWENGKHYVRISLALDDKQLEEATERLTDLANMYNG